MDSFSPISIILFNGDGSIAATNYNVSLIFQEQNHNQFQNIEQLENNIAGITNFFNDYTKTTKDKPNHISNIFTFSDASKLNHYQLTFSALETQSDNKFLALIYKINNDDIANMSTWNEEQFQAFINSAGHYIYTLDLNLCITSFNKSFKKVFFDIFKHEIKIGEKPDDFVPSEISNSWSHHYLKVISGEQVSFPYEIGNGYFFVEMFPIKIDGKISGISVFSEDKTIEQTLINSLKESKFIHEFAMDVSDSGFWDWNLETNEVVYSDIWKSMLGYAPHEIKNTYFSWELLVHPDDLPNALTEVKKHINGETKTYSVQKRMLCKDGSYKWILAKGRIVTYDEKGKPKRFIGVHIDVDEVYNTRQELKNKNLQLEKIAFINAHKIRKPMANIQGLTSIMKDKLVDENELNNYLTMLLESINELNEQTNALNNTINKEEIKALADSRKALNSIRNILVLDDDPINNYIAIKMIQKTGVSCVSFTKPSEAFEYLKASNDVDLILLDLNMPVYNGWEFLDNLEKAQINTPVIIVSSSSNQKDKLRAKTYKNVCDYWIKPLKVELLKNLIS
ncbi:MAG: PAS domain-containing protein [Bacteroidetes bacterium]|nr:PAS domain-containing protein [Bacteroidota bacterium]